MVLHSHRCGVSHFHGAVFAQSRTCRFLRALSQPSRATVNHTSLNCRKFDPSLLGPYQQLTFTLGHGTIAHLRKKLAQRTDEESLLNVGHPLCGIRLYVVLAELGAKKNKVSEVASTN